MGLVFEAVMPPTEKILLLALADHASHDGGGVYISQTLMMLKTSMGIRSIQRHLAGFIRDGILILEEPPRQHHSAHYRINLKTVEALTFRPANLASLAVVHDIPDPPTGTSRGANSEPRGATGGAPNRTTKATVVEPATTTLSGAPPDAVSPNGHSLPRYKIEALEILAWLNKKAGTRYEPVEANLGLICARLKEADRPAWRLKQLVSAKATEWPPGHDMRKYLRPSTLFNREKCANYLGQLPPAKDIP